MFLQVIDGKVADQSGFEKVIDRWMEDLSPGATGWLGTTWGAYGDSSMIAVVRFASQEAAERNGGRPEHKEWWAEVVSVLETDPDIQDFEDVLVLGPGASDDAGFVQIMRGHVADIEKERKLAEQMSSMPSDFRPDILGAVEGFQDDGAFVMALYFTSEAEARVGEKKPVPPEVQELMADGEANTTDMTFTDLSAPRFLSPR